MQIVRQEAIDAFTNRHTDSHKPFQRWIQIVQLAEWKNILDVQSVFQTAEDVKGKVVFNIKGNHYRLITAIDYRAQQVFILDVLTHAQYDRWTP
jgi:mRNA interferase HigB